MSRYLKREIEKGDFSDKAATVVGFGYMGREHLKALQALGFGSISICSRSEEKLKAVANQKGVTTVSGGFSRLMRDHVKSAGLAIIATPTPELIPATLHLVELGFKKFLIEKPVSYYSDAIEILRQKLNDPSFEIVCAFNRSAYPAVAEARQLAEEEGGITSCVYTMTEMIRDNWITTFSKDELARWGVANSTHVASLAHALIGLPKKWKAEQYGKGVAWHPSGSVFTGMGLSDRDIPFVYHGDWTSKSRWSVEFHTSVASYRLCPLEKLYRKTNALEEWVELPLDCFAPEVKTGLAEQIAAMFSASVRDVISPYSLKETHLLTRFGEDIFGYTHC